MKPGILAWPGLALGLLFCAACAPSPVPTSTTASAPTPAASSADRGASNTRQRIEAAIDHVRRRQLQTTNAFWTVFHGVLGLGPAGLELYDPVLGRSVNAVDYMAEGKPMRGMVFQPTADGVDVITTSDGVGQGHQDQFVAEMAQWGMPADRRFRVGDREYPFAAFVRQSRQRARVTANQELAWAVLIIAQYYGTDAAWTNANGEKLTLEDIVRYELAQPMATAACGGTHRLFGLDWALQLHLHRGGAKTGVWLEVEAFARRHAQLARQFQGVDGALSTAIFQERQHDPDPVRRIYSTGHTLEWLALSLSDAELRADWVERAANALALQILDLRGSTIESGALYHATHGLLMYYARLHGTEFLGVNAPFFPWMLPTRVTPLP